MRYMLLVPVLLCGCVTNNVGAESQAWCSEMGVIQGSPKYAQCMSLAQEAIIKDIPNADPNEVLMQTRQLCLDSGHEHGSQAYRDCFSTTLYSVGIAQDEAGKARKEKWEAVGEAFSPNSSRRKYVSDDDGTVYSRDECIGPVIMGECEGTIAPKGGYHKTCHGEMLNGKCTGPMF